MSRIKLVIISFLLLSFVLLNGCGRKTAPVYAEKDEITNSEKDKIKE